MSHPNIRRAVTTFGALGVLAAAYLAGGATASSIREGLNDVQTTLVEGLGGQMPPTPAPTPDTPETYVGKCFTTSFVRPGDIGYFELGDMNESGTYTYNNGEVFITNDDIKIPLEEGVENAIRLADITGDDKDPREIQWEVTDYPGTPSEAAVVRFITGACGPTSGIER